MPSHHYSILEKVRRIRYNKYLEEAAKEKTAKAKNAGSTLSVVEPLSRSTSGDDDHLREKDSSDEGCGSSRTHQLLGISFARSVL